ncbi:hypothetical protein BV898_02514 [Hypsibius exemplaris]|uniref:EB domain-containing protein n=1 Tax=Hypsibius exemplaris TaxID=2072580 RepID=A0A1W0X8S1_HYPEX|nr:hypothetical protein BV898_02514 [Hypsibius exemplaris]
MKSFVVWFFCTLCLPYTLKASQLCNPAIYRCPGSQVAFKYNKKSECLADPTAGLQCGDAKTNCICLSVDKVCLKAPKYAGVQVASDIGGTNGDAGAYYTNMYGETVSTSESPTTASTAATTAKPANATDELCRLPFMGDNSECDSHSSCSPIAAGIALCCNGKCLHVQNVPCVRDFFKKEDQLCSDSDYNQLFSPELIANHDE